MSHRLLFLTGRLELTTRQHAAPERVLVDQLPEHRLVHSLQLEQGEVFGQQLESDRRIVELAAQSLDRQTDDVLVVEGAGEQLPFVGQIDGATRRT